MSPVPCPCRCSTPTTAPEVLATSSSSSWDSCLSNFIVVPPNHAPAAPLASGPCPDRDFPHLSSTEDAKLELGADPFLGESLDQIVHLGESLPVQRQQGVAEQNAAQIGRPIRLDRDHQQSRFLPRSARRLDRQSDRHAPQADEGPAHPAMFNQG